MKTSEIPNLPKYYFLQTQNWAISLVLDPILAHGTCCQAKESWGNELLPESCHCQEIFCLVSVQLHLLSCVKESVCPFVMIRLPTCLQCQPFQRQSKGTIVLLQIRLKNCSLNMQPRLRRGLEWARKQLSRKNFSTISFCDESVILTVFDFQR